MSDRHFFNGKSTLVDQFLLGFAATRPDLHLKRSARVLHRSERDVSKVALISGGGAGHEPGAVGMVGKGGLDAAVIGDVFASPRAEQVLAAIEAVPSEAGTILVVPNCERTRSYSVTPTPTRSIASIDSIAI
jgi:dihydroxyacetone kinase